ncbi:hypothetical protein B1757_12985 [Acidithiobacillus marinus]|uniref:Uncharacterized protein n=1 Tax=Acidithiobacillus marinus TaxID=187490 RepID=A0A2I1DIV1_9PROT|nr:hypothetical protein [Acidithiobacillus marinus]PKY09796.1 hypothetical protein B1757_12985 [Acidithiobacillus marinus]
MIENTSATKENSTAACFPDSSNLTLGRTGKENRRIHMKKLMMRCLTEGGGKLKFIVMDNICDNRELESILHRGFSE